MPDALELLKTRRSIPAAFLKDPGPDENQLRDILTVGARVPDHGKLAPWRFVVVTGEARDKAAAALHDLHTKERPELPEKAVEIRDRWAAVPVSLLLVSKTAAHPKIPEWEQFISAGSVALNVIHASHAMGFAAQWLTGWLSESAAAAAIFGVEGDEKVVAAIHIGTPTMPPSERDRPDIDKITRFWEG